jgi:hypothetical protein
VEENPQAPLCALYQAQMYNWVGPMKFCKQAGWRSSSKYSCRNNVLSHALIYSRINIKLSNIHTCQKVKLLFTINKSFASEIPPYSYAVRQFPSVLYQVSISKCFIEVNILRGQLLHYFRRQRASWYKNNTKNFRSGLHFKFKNSTYKVEFKLDVHQRWAQKRCLK